MVPVSFAPLEFAGQGFMLTRTGALYWEQEQALLVADLHLEKGSYYAARGQMLPPYDSRETLARLAQAAAHFGVARVITLGDNFHDDDGALRLEAEAAAMLRDLTGRLDWLWITGNHDENMPHGFGAERAEEAKVGGIILRHEARPGETGAELSGHFHPKIRMQVRGRHIARPCAVIARAKIGTQERMIMPAFGAYTGGMDAGAPEIAAALSPASVFEAVLEAKGKALRFPLAHMATQ